MSPAARRLHREPSRTPPCTFPIACYVAPHPLGSRQQCCHAPPPPASSSTCRASSSMRRSCAVPLRQHMELPAQCSCSPWRRSLLPPKDGNGADWDQVKSLYIQTQNPKSKPEIAPNNDLGDNPSPKPNPRIHETRIDIQNPLSMAT